jgi:hypothetical protein
VETLCRWGVSSSSCGWCSSTVPLCRHMSSPGDADGRHRLAICLQCGWNDRGHRDLSLRCRQVERTDLYLAHLLVYSNPCSVDPTPQTRLQSDLFRDPPSRPSTSALPSSSSILSHASKQAESLGSAAVKARAAAARPEGVRGLVYHFVETGQIIR